MGVFLGLLLHAIGGFAAGSFYIPFKLIKKWSWETSWMILGFAAWILTPMILALLTVPHLFQVLFSPSLETLSYTFIFGILWGVGGLTFGLSLRYLGIGLGMAIALGFTTAFGTLVPPLYYGNFKDLIQTKGGILVLLGVFVCLLGIVLAGRAGMLKEKDLDHGQLQQSIKEFDLKKGITIAILSGILSACFAFGLATGKPIAEKALENGVRPIFQNNAVLVWILWGGFLTNFIWTLALGIKNRSFSNFMDKNIKGKSKNYFLAMAGGVTWYFQFFFYGMGATQFGEEYEFASWSLHMAFIILFSTLWGIYFKEWKGVSPKTMSMLWQALGLIVISTLLIGIGNHL